MNGPTSPEAAVTQSVSVVIDRPPAVVWAAVSDITRTGEWSPECIAGRWIDGATGPAAGARFEGDNAVTVAGRAIKRWTTTSEVTECTAEQCFEFVSAGYTTWRYDLVAEGEGTKVTESYRHAPHKGWQKFLYDTVARRDRSMRTGMQRTLERMKAVLEAS